MIVDIRFDPRFRPQILSGTKTSTLRRRAKGTKGDLFRVDDTYYQITDVRLCDDFPMLLSLWKDEGFDTALDMLDWIDAHDYGLPLFIHRFERYIGDLSLCGNDYFLCYKPYTSMTRQRLCIQSYEGVYRLDSGNILEAHECMDPQWAEDEPEPTGAVYYEIYGPSAIGESNPVAIDGGLMGYGEDDTLADLDMFLLRCNQGCIMEMIGVPDSCKEA